MKRILASAGLIACGLLCGCDVPEPTPEQREAAKIRHDATIQQVCISGYLYVVVNAYSKLGISQILVNGENGLQAVQCTPK